MWMELGQCNIKSPLLIRRVYVLGCKGDNSIFEKRSSVMSKCQQELEYSGYMLCLDTGVLLTDLTKKAPDLNTLKIETQ